jgi:metallo-beta-lactamase family protein
MLPNEYKISFYGASQEITGSCFLLESKNTRLLIDCGLFQCPKFCDIRNEKPFPFDVKGIDALVVTHAHIDHIGRVPKLIKTGFKGRIFSTPPTRDFARIMLLDSMGVLEKEARRENKSAFYGEEDVEGAMEKWEAVEYHQEFKVGDFRIILKDAGHILGSAIIEINSLISENSNEKGKKIVFTGDLGNPPVPLLRPTEDIFGANVLIVDSTYGDRLHEDKKERVLKLERIIEDTIRKKGVLMIPAFSLERTQEILFELNNLVEKGRVPVVPFFLDSPLAIKATEIYKKYDKYYNKQAKYIMSEGDRLFQFPGLKFTLKTEDSKSINDALSPKIIIAGSGMLNGGRMVHHVKRYISDKNSALLFVGYQAAGSLGRIIKDGAKEIAVFGEKVPIRAKIETIYGYSAHPDRDQLFNFIQNTSDSLEQVFTIHGEPKSLLFFVQRIRDYLGVNASAPNYGDQFKI